METHDIDTRHRHRPPESCLDPMSVPLGVVVLLAVKVALLIALLRVRPPRDGIEAWNHDDQLPR